MLADLDSRKKVVGTRQTIRAIKKKKAIRVFLADDIDSEIKVRIESVLENTDIPVEYIDSKLKLGRVCGVDVATATAALLK